MSIKIVIFFNTVKVMNMSRYRYRFGPYVTSRYRFQANVTQHDINITDRFRSLPNFSVTSLTDPNKVTVGKGR